MIAEYQRQFGLDRPLWQQYLTYLGDMSRLDFKYSIANYPKTVMQMMASIKRLSLHIVTTAVNVALELRDAPDITVMLTGGLMRARTAEVVGHVCERTLRDINLDLAIIGADGVHSDLGFTTYNSEEAYTNRVMIDRAREVWIVADRSKLGQVRPAIIHDISVASLLITDSGASPDQVEAIRQKGTEVVCV